ncbi:hypothetical protein ABZ671_16560 [Micromonospora sp. NPDC006766]|uniref:hypothetical protein n=1 Tax=Micromonospora sp. NPDC006766 TaxID=3154778 RepID=UPI00341040BD
MAEPHEAEAELDRLLRSADPGPGPNVTALVDEIGQAVMVADPIRSTDRRGAGRGRRWSAAAVVGVVAALLTATTAVAYTALVSARTGEYGKPGVTENDTSEWLRSDGDDFRKVVEELRPTEVPVPPGFTYAANVDAYVESNTKERVALQVTKCGPPTRTGRCARGSATGWPRTPSVTNPAVRPPARSCGMRRPGR